MNDTGLIVTSYGRQFIVEVDGINYQAVTRAKKVDYVVGDRVKVDIINSQQLQIMELLPRTGLVYRIDQSRSKIIASNVEQLLIVIAVKPSFDSDFLNSCLIFAEAHQIEPIIVLNKIDLPESKDFILKIEELYQKKLSYSLIKLSALGNCNKLNSVLAHKNSLFIGQSGMGKSTITNQIIPSAKSRTGELGKFEASGCHTTTNATLYHINADSSIIDCPGLQGFGLYDINIEDLISYFPELQKYIGQCKFHNCRHLTEPGCVVTKAHADGVLDSGRFNYLQNLTQQLLQKH